MHCRFSLIYFFSSPQRVNSASLFLEHLKIYDLNKWGYFVVRNGNGICSVIIQRVWMLLGNLYFRTIMIQVFYDFKKWRSKLRQLSDKESIFNYFNILSVNSNLTDIAHVTYECSGLMEGVMSSPRLILSLVEWSVKKLRRFTLPGLSEL